MLSDHSHDGRFSQGDAGCRECRSKRGGATLSLQSVLLAPFDELAPAHMLSWPVTA